MRTIELDEQQYQTLTRLLGMRTRKVARRITKLEDSIEKTTYEEELAELESLQEAINNSEDDTDENEEEE